MCFDTAELVLINVCYTFQVLAGQIYLAGGKLTYADVLLLECTLMLEEKFTGILADFPNTKVQYIMLTV